MSVQTFGWLILLFPLAGCLVISLGYKLWGERAPGVIGTVAIAALVRLRDRRADHAPGPRPGGAPGRHGRVELREHRRRRRAALAAARPALDLHGAGGLGRVDADPPLLGRLHEVGPRLHALLRVPELLRLLDAAAGPGRQLHDPDRRLGVRRRRVLPADLVLVPARDGDAGGHQGVRHQRRRRRRARDRHLLHLQGLGLAGLPHDVRVGRRGLHAQRQRSRRGLHRPAHRRVREVRPGAAAHLAAGRHGGPDAGLGPDPRGHDGDRRRLPDRAHAPALRAGPDRRRRRLGHRLRDARHRGLDRARGDRPQTRHRLLDDVPDRLHDHGRLERGLHRRPLPPDDARVLQGAALHGGRLGDRRDGRQPEPRRDGRLPARDAVHVRLHADRRPRAVGRPAVLRLLLQGRDPRLRRRARRLARRAGRGRVRRLVPDRDLHVPDDLPHVLGRGGRAGEGPADDRPPLPRARAHQPGHRRGRGHRRRLPRARSPHRRARGLDEGRDGRARRARDHRRPPPGPGGQPRAATTSSSRPSPTRATTRRSSPRTG